METAIPIMEGQAGNLDVGNNLGPDKIAHEKKKDISNFHVLKLINEEGENPDTSFAFSCRASGGKSTHGNGRKSTGGGNSESSDSDMLDVVEGRRTFMKYCPSEQEKGTEEYTSWRDPLDGGGDPSDRIVTGGGSSFHTAPVDGSGEGTRGESEISRSHSPSLSPSGNIKHPPSP